MFKLFRLWLYSEDKDNKIASLLEQVKVLSQQLTSANNNVMVLNTKLALSRGLFYGLHGAMEGLVANDSTAFADAVETHKYLEFMKQEYEKQVGGTV